MSARAAPVVLAAPSGTGKTTLARRLVEGSDRYRFSVSATTRAPRGAERDGIDYHFVDRGRFEEMLERNELLEWAEVHGRLYGTPRRPIEEAAEAGIHVLLDIDVQGADQLRRMLPDVKLVFVLPPSLDVLMERLRARGTETPEDLRVRLRTAIGELRRAEEFDYVVVNDDLERCVREIDDIVRGGLATGRTSADAEHARALGREMEEWLGREGPGFDMRSGGGR